MTRVSFFLKDKHTPLFSLLLTPYLHCSVTACLSTAHLMNPPAAAAAAAAIKTGSRLITNPRWNRQFSFLQNWRRPRFPVCLSVYPTPHYNVLKPWLWCWGLAITHHLMSKAYCRFCQAIIFSWHNQIKHRNVLIRKEQQTLPPKHPADPPT